MKTAPKSTKATAKPTKPAAKSPAKKPTKPKTERITPNMSIIERIAIKAKRAV